jgi:hypothetical protein
VWVSAVVVFWNEFPEGVAESDRLTYVHGSRLLQFLKDRPERLNSEAVTAISNALADLKTERTREHLRLVTAD